MGDTGVSVQAVIINMKTAVARMEGRVIGPIMTRTTGRRSGRATLMRVFIRFVRRRLRPGVALPAAIASVTGVVAALYYHRMGLTLSHYDARGHLVVARRIVDSVTPGWQQIGAVWLPLPHLLNVLPVQLDFFYRTGASAVAISIISFVAAAGAIAWMVIAITESALAALAAASVFILNPNVVYLQSTPMTELPFMALMTIAVAMLIEEVEEAGLGGGAGRAASKSSEARRSHATGVAFALACLTRYEAWPVTATALALTVWALWRGGAQLLQALRRVSAIALLPAIACIGFVIFSRVVIGEWFVASGFFVPENKARGDLWMAVKEIAWGAQMLSSPPLMWLGAAGLCISLGLAVGCVPRLGVRLGAEVAASRRVAAVLTIALLGTAATPLVAFYIGHPFRIRYMVPLVAAQAIGVGVAAGAFRRARAPAAMAAAVLAAVTLRPLDRSAAMVVEAQWDRPNVSSRARVTACLGPPQPGDKIMASMGSLGHYMQEASQAGFALRDFLHEGNGDIWLAAIDGPRPFARWVLIEEKAEGGDFLAHVAREHPHFLDGYSRVCEGAGLALYRRE